MEEQEESDRNNITQSSSSPCKKNKSFIVSGEKYYDPISDLVSLVEPDDLLESESDSIVEEEESSPVQILDISEVDIDAHKLGDEAVDLVAILGESNDSEPIKHCREEGDKNNHDFNEESMGMNAEEIQNLMKALKESNEKCLQLDLKLSEADAEYQKKITETTINVTTDVTSRVTLAMAEKIKLSEKLAKERGKELERLKVETNAEIDEVMQSLDRVEADYASKLDDIQRQLHEKEIAYAELANQLAESRLLMQTAEAEMRQLDEKLHNCEDKRSAFQSELEESTTKFRKAIDDEKARRQIEIDAAKMSIKLAAEEQFGEANKLYMKLKKDHDTLSEENAILLGEKKDFARREAELLSEVAQIRADLARADVVVAKTKHQAFEETDKLQSELDRTNEELRSLQQLCEELMEIVESKDNSVENHAS
mmetsp:Transcript_7575/g.9714  ORF Transcript_7575/g.9714 Transcript_7575/m.9714 type:complete len:426 (+) Transcript_7575:110-1387(+)